MKTTGRVRRWFANWRVSRRKRAESEWGDLLGVMLRSRRMRPRRKGDLP